MDGVSWRGDDPRCPQLSELRLLRIPYWNFENEEVVGELVVAKSAAADIAAAFESIWRERFPIHQMVRIDHFGADDERSMTANNCSAFCFRDIAATGALSKHALGLAVDINPVQNPYVIGDQIWPAEGANYLDRTEQREGMIVRPSVVVDAFAAIGWEWGGDWTTKSDYHHFAVP